MRTPKEVSSINLECTCVGISQREWDMLMKNATRANTVNINRIVRKMLPDLAEELGLFDKPLKDLGWYNPYNYFKTKKHLILVHSGIEYFLNYSA